jgi:hypothetical protein
VNNTSDSLNILHTKFDSVYKVQVIPPDALNGEYDVLIYHHDFDFDLTPNNDTNKYGFEISWPSPIIDGGFRLVINPRQIFLRSGHDNPNPNYLYWFVNIDTAQYNLIKSHLISLFNKKFEYYHNNHSLFYLLTPLKYLKESPIPDEVSDKEYKKLEKDAHSKLYKNLIQFLKILNIPLALNGNEIKYPTYKYFSNIKLLRMVDGNQDEINDILKAKRRRR